MRLPVNGGAARGSTVAGGRWGAASGLPPDAPRAARWRPARCLPMDLPCAQCLPAVDANGTAEDVTARWWSRWCDAAGGKPLASCRSALGKAPRRDGPSAKARGADGGEDGPPRGRRRGRAAAAHLRAWRRRRPGRRHAGWSRATSAGPAGDLRWGRTCVRKAKTIVGRIASEQVFASYEPRNLALERQSSGPTVQRILRGGVPRKVREVGSPEWSTSASSHPMPSP